MSGVRPRRTSWGWHRLDPEWADRLVETAGVRSDETVVDVGAGDGAITAALLARAARVVAVELHPGRAERLRRRFGSEITVVETDLRDFPWPRRPHRVVANPPFALTSPLLHALLRSGNRLYRADLVLQRAVVRRVLEGGGVPVPRGFVAGSPLQLPRSAFRPRPPVDTAVLSLRRAGGSAPRGTR